MTELEKSARYNKKLSGTSDGMPARSGRMPDFVIGGAPKCGTTSLHFILGQHPEIGIPDDEVSYFDADDPIVHPDYFFNENGHLAWFDARPSHDENLSWYLSRFAPYSECRLVGEDSTNYLFSDVAPHRIKDAFENPKIIFMLRDPVKRAYSQYWHEMKLMRVTCSFETAICRFPSIIRGSSYAPHLLLWKTALGADAIKVIFFEEFLSDMQSVVDEVTDFIGAARMDMSGVEGWFNKTSYPISVTGQKSLNLVGQFIARQRYRSHMGKGSTFKERFTDKIYQKWFHKVNPLLMKSEAYPPMREDTKAFLIQHLAARNRGLSVLLGRDVSEVWPAFPA